MSDVSTNLKRFRKKAGITQVDLAEKLNVTRQAISNWENGKSYPDVDTILSIAEVFDTDTNNLLYPPEKQKRRIFQSVSLKPVLITVIIFFVIIVFGGGYWSMFLQSFVGGGVAETFIYPLYLGIILLAGLIVGCTCVIIEELRNVNFHNEFEDSKH